MSKLQRWFQMNVQGRSGKIHTFETPLTVSFDTSRTSFSSLNTGHFAIKNLSRQTRLDLQYDFQYDIVPRTFTFFAGYQSEGWQPLVFVGTLQKAFSYRDGPDVVTDITVLDGGKAALTAQINRPHTFPWDAKTEMTALVQTLNQYGVTLGAIGTLFNGFVPTRGTTWVGNTWDVVSNFCGDLGGYACIDGGKVYLLAQSDVVAASGSVTTIDASTGLIGTPRRSGWSVDAAMLFEPRISLLQKLAISSDVEPSINGTYSVQTVAHRGIISGAVAGDLLTHITMVGSPTGFTTVATR